MFKPLQANLRVYISRFRARIILFRGEIRDLVTLIGCSWPNNYYKKRPTVYRYILDCDGTKQSRLLA